jgi:hypothetical protein
MMQSERSGRNHQKNAMKLSEVKGRNLWRRREGYVNVMKWNERKIIVKPERNSS